MSAAPVKPPANAAADRDARNRREIVTTIKGPVLARVLELIPDLRAFPDPYVAVMASPELLHACLQLVRTRRDCFQEFLVDPAGAPVSADDVPLRCERSLDQVISMVVRSGAKAYSQKRFAPAPDKAPVTPAVKPESRTLLEKVAALVLGKWSEAEVPKRQATQADQFYESIKDFLDYDWQVPLIPYFAELPPRLIRELGRGVTSLRTAEGILALADIGRHSMEQAKKILSSAEMREMLDTQPLAAKGVAFLGPERYEFLRDAVYGKMGENFWEMCVDCDRLEAMETQNAKDLEQMASHLHILSADAINQIIRCLQFAQIPIFLETGSAALGEAKFAEIFGLPGNKKLTKIFCEKIAATRLDPADPDGDLRRKLPDVFQAYLRAPDAFERGL
ncbi:hypothetical protein [Phaeospirillum tilakii]|uniref:DUF2336 domain-containing protein n=1 Tax=Phaeospirillum tilakii TaxID=741673 RepID=A0ABW5CA40_9PROT